jgi:hypothetical protein
MKFYVRSHKNYWPGNPPIVAHIVVMPDTVIIGNAPVAKAGVQRGLFAEFWVNRR